jgi:OFA family oxalate/formate antiporter-like MFS transporter
MAVMSSEVGRGWSLVFAASIGVACSSIVLPFYTIGAFVKPLAAEFGWARADVTSAIIFSTGIGALTAPIIGWLSDRYGPRALVLPSLVGLSLGFMVAASMNGELWMFFAAYACMAVLGAGTIPVTWTRAIATSFDKQRGLALGLTLTGSGLCGIVAPYIAVQMIEHWGWRGAYVGIGLLPIVLALPIVFLAFKPRPYYQLVPSEAAANGEPPAWGQTLGEAMRGYRFWLLCVSILGIYLAVSGISPNLIAALTDEGMSATTAASAAGTFGVAVTLGRVVIGYLVDRIWAPGVACVVLALPAIGCLMLTTEQSFANTVLAIALIGFAAGAELDLMAYFAARYFGLRHYATIYALLYAMLCIAGGIAPRLFSAFYDRTQSYDQGFNIAAGLFVFGAVILLGLGRYPDAVRAAARTEST